MWATLRRRLRFPRTSTLVPSLDWVHMVTQANLWQVKQIAVHSFLITCSNQPPAFVGCCWISEKLYVQQIVCAFRTILCSSRVSSTQRDLLPNSWLRISNPMCWSCETALASHTTFTLFNPSQNFGLFGRISSILNCHTDLACAMRTLVLGYFSPLLDKTRRLMQYPRIRREYAVYKLILA